MNFRLFSGMSVWRYHGRDFWRNLERIKDELPKGILGKEFPKKSCEGIPGGIFQAIPEWPSGGISEAIPSEIPGGNAEGTPGAISDKNAGTILKGAMVGT